MTALFSLETALFRFFRMGLTCVWVGMYQVYRCDVSACAVEYMCWSRLQSCSSTIVYLYVVNIPGRYMPYIHAKQPRGGLKTTAPTTPGNKLHAART